MKAAERPLPPAEGLRNILVIMAKEPVAGSVKTRLTPPLSPAAAAAIYHSALLDRMAAARKLPGVTPVIAYSPGGARAFFRRLAGEDVSLLPQSGGGLGERLEAVAAAFVKEEDTVLAIADSDSPDLPAAFFAEAFERVRGGADVVFGPCSDGGYYLVAFGREHPGLFRGIPWSTPDVLDRSLAMAADLGLKAELLPPWSDIDTIEDLHRFYLRFRRAGGDDAPAGRLTGSRVESLLGEGALSFE